MYYPYLHSYVIIMDKAFSYTHLTDSCREGVANILGDRNQKFNSYFDMFQIINGPFQTI
jgi:hypothetical protein